MDITKRFVTLWIAFLLFTSGACADSFIVNYSLNDSYGDGWTGAAINVLDEEGNIVKQLTIANGDSNNGTLELNGSYFEFVWQKGKYDGECSNRRESCVKQGEGVHLFIVTNCSLRDHHNSTVNIG